MKELADLAESFDQTVKGAGGTGSSFAKKAKQCAFGTTNCGSENQKGRTSKRECFVCNCPPQYAHECPNTSGLQVKSMNPVEADAPENGLVARVAGDRLNCEQARSRENHVKSHW